MLDYLILGKSLSKSIYSNIKSLTLFFVICKPNLFPAETKFSKEIYPFFSIKNKNLIQYNN